MTCQLHLVERLIANFRPAATLSASAGARQNNFRILGLYV